MSATRALVCLTALALVSGCASLPAIRDSGRAEIAWQALHAVDIGQTVTVARNPDSVYESDTITRRLIGRHPSEVAVYGWGAGMAALHYAVSAWLDREVDTHDSRPWRIARVAWHAITIGDVGYAVGHNFANGVRLFAGRRHLVSWPLPCTVPVTYVPCLDSP